MSPAEDTITGHCVCKQYTVTIPRPSVMNLCRELLPISDWGRNADSQIVWTAEDGLDQSHVQAPEEKVKFEGPTPRTHTVKGVDGMDMTRAWCDTCGSGLYIMPEGTGGPSFFKAGLFNPGDVPKPTMETFTKDMESWESVAHGVKPFEKNGNLI